MMLINAPFVRKIESITARLLCFFSLVLLAICFTVISGAHAALDSLARKDGAGTTAPLVFGGLGADELSVSGFFASSRAVAQDWQQYAARDEVKPKLQAPARILVESAEVPLTSDATRILLLTLRANNIQVREDWRVTNALNAFDIDGNGELYLTVVNESATFVATVYLVDEFQMLNAAYQNLTASAVITVEVMLGYLSMEQPPPLEVLIGIAEEVYVFKASGGTMPYTYTLLHNPDDDAFAFTNGTLSVNANATLGEYRFTVAVADAASMAVTVTATVEVAAAPLVVAQPPRLKVTEGVAGEVYVFKASGGIMPHTYTLLHNPDDDAFYFTHGTLSINVSATIGEYRFTVEVVDAASIAVTVTATVEVVAALSMAQPPRLEVTAGIAGEVYVFEASGGIMPHTYTLLHNPDDSAFYFNQGTLSVNVSATIGEYRFTVAVVDAASMAVTVTATVGVAAAPLVAAQPPRLEVTEGVAGEVYVFEASGGIMPHTYTLLHNPDDDAFYFTHGTLSVNVSATIGEYRFTVAVVDAASMAVTVTATVEVVAALSMAQPPRLEVTAGVAGEVYVFEASGGIMPHTYTLLHNPDDSAFYFTHGTLSVNVSATIGEYRFTVAVVDAASMAVTVTATVGVEAPPPLVFLAEVPPLAVAAGVSVNLYTFAAIGGVGDKRYTIVAGNEGGFVLAADSGVLSLLPKAAEGVYTLEVEASDRALLPDRITAAATVRVGDRQIFMLGGWNDTDRTNEVWSAADGKYWARAANADWPGRTGHQAVVHNGRLYVLGGIEGELGFGSSAINDVWSSVDGRVWVEETVNAGWSKRDDHQAVSHQGRLYVLGGYDGSAKNDVWSSADGKMWTEETADAGWSRRFAHQAVSFNGRLYVLGGYTDFFRSPQNDVWSSADGKIWVEETINAGWLARVYHQAVSNNGRLYVLGGEDRNGDERNDVWSSADGETWREETNSAGWSRRSSHQAVSHNDRLYVLGGNLGLDNGEENDVWSSADGKIWVEETDDAGWSKRFYHQSVVFPPALNLAGVSERLVLTTGIAAPLHTFTAQYGVGDYTYSLNPAVDGFAVSPGGVLSTEDNVSAGEYVLTVWVEDSRGNHAQTAARAIVPSPLTVFSLTDAPPLLAFAGTDADLHLFGHGLRYTIVAGNQPRYFVLHRNSGQLSTLPQAVPGVYTLTVGVSDWFGEMTELLATVEVLPNASPLSVPEGAVGELYTFAISGGLGAKTYRIVLGNEDGYFALDGASGVLSASGQATAGLYILMIEASFDTASPSQATAAVNMAVGRNIFVLGGYEKLPFANFPEDDVWSSAEGKVWVKKAANVGWGGRIQAVSHHDRLYVLGGDENGNKKNDVWSSADGKNWVLETAAAKWSKRNYHQSLSHRGRLYVLGGLNGGSINDVWSSVDGKSWVEETAHAGWSGRSGHQAVSHHGRLYVLGGLGGSRRNDVWSAADGKVWVEESAAAGWSGRNSHQAVSHRGRLYVLGGLGGLHGGSMNDVWSSADGRVWVEETAAAGWSGREGHQALSYRGRLYVLGGFDGGSINDVWSSADGKDWSLVTVSANWSERLDHQAVIFPPQLELVGVGDRLTITTGTETDVHTDVHTFTAQYGVGEYTYSLDPAAGGFFVTPRGVLSADSSVSMGEHTLTVWVEDAAGDRAQTAIRIYAISSSLSLAEVPLESSSEIAVNVHTFAPWIVEAKTYAAIVGNEKVYFVLGENSILNNIAAPPPDRSA